MGRPRERRGFQPCTPPRVVRDHTLAGRPVLLLGWWLDAAGSAEAVEVATMSSERRPFDISDFPAPPGPFVVDDAQPEHADG